MISISGGAFHAGIPYFVFAAVGAYTLRALITRRVGGGVITPLREGAGQGRSESPASSAQAQIGLTVLKVMVRATLAVVGIVCGVVLAVMRLIAVVLITLPVLVLDRVMPGQHGTLERILRVLHRDLGIDADVDEQIPGTSFGQPRQNDPGTPKGRGRHRRP